LETSLFTFWEVSEADWEGLLSKPEIQSFILYVLLSAINNLLGSQLYVKNIFIHSEIKIRGYYVAI
jgi:hypothetical protein